MLSLNKISSTKILDFFKEEVKIKQKDHEADEQAKIELIRKYIADYGIFSSICHAKYMPELLVFIWKLGREDNCFSGTSGEFAFRLISTLTSDYIKINKNLKYVERMEDIQEKSILLFKGVFFAPWEISYDCKKIKKDSFKNLMRVKSDKIYTIKNAIWIADDASIVGYGDFPPADIDCNFIIISLDKYPNAKYILESLVYLKKMQKSMISVSPYLDLRFGAIDPELMENISNQLSTATSILKGFPARSPSEFIYNITDNHKKLIIDHRMSKYMIFEFRYDNCEDVYIQWGPSNAIDFSDKETLALYRLDTFSAYLLFGPPLHILSPMFELTDYKLKDVIRFQNDHLLQMPAIFMENQVSDNLMEEYFPKLHQKIINFSKSKQNKKF